MTSDALPECPVVVDAPAPTPSDMPTIHEENATAESTTVTAVIATDIATDATTALVAAEEKYPKRKVALLMSFCGTGYYGMQINAGFKTIEGELFAALTRVGAVSERNAEDVAKVQFLRAARTDKGVHAAGQVVSLKMVLRPNVIETLNAELPEQIRVWTATRTNNKFNARTSCDSRRYEYLLPTYILAEMGETERALYDVDLTEELEQTLRSYATGGANLEREEEKGGSSANCGKRARADDDGDDEAGAVAEGDESEEEEEEGAQEGLPVCDDDEILDADGNFVPAAESTTDAPRGQPRAPGLKHFVNSKTTFRLAADQLERVRTMLRLYEGSHNFHNFTVRMPLSDPSSRRNMIKIECTDPFMLNGMEWISVRLHGQSFILHQIRKMIGMLVMLMRTGGHPQIITKAFGAYKFHIPKAPALGLLLLEPVFRDYNRRIQDPRAPESLRAEPIDFEAHRTAIDAFKERWIYKEVFEREREDHAFARWMLSLRKYARVYFYMFARHGNVEGGEVPAIFGELARMGVNDPKRPRAPVRQFSAAKRRVMMRRE